MKNLKNNVVKEGDKSANLIETPIPILIEGQCINCRNDRLIMKIYFYSHYGKTFRLGFDKKGKVTAVDVPTVTIGVYIELECPKCGYKIARGFGNPLAVNMLVNDKALENKKWTVKNGRIDIVD